MYENHFGFTIKPFQTIPNPDVFYPSPKHENALTYLEYGLMERTGFILLTGEIGSGKTTLIKHLINKFEPKIDIAVIFNTNVTAEQLIGLILNEFELGLGIGSKADALDILYQFLIDKFAHNRRVLLVIDEAQNLSRDALEEVRMLSNLQSDDQMLLQIMLVGQPELRTKIRKPNLAQLNQRITVAYHLPALTREETGAYIVFRLEKAGGKPDIFSQDAIDLIHKTSSGIPRTINIICDTALVYAYADDLKAVDVSVIKQVIEDREGVGLSYNTIVTPETKDTPRNYGALLKRVETLEESFNKFQLHMATRMGDAEVLSQRFRDELITQLKDQYERELTKNRKILVEYTKLKDKYFELLKKLKIRDNPNIHIQEKEGSPIKLTNTSAVALQETPAAMTFDDIRQGIRKELDDALKEINSPVTVHAKGKEPSTRKSSKKTAPKSTSSDS
jgi:general secretion pathway protein A